MSGYQSQMMEFDESDELDEKHTVDERVQDGHSTVGNTSIWVDLLED